ncbi:MAG TPA: type II secretion system protein GspK [Polyangiaceae bacterium]|jgi:general secretion pathway protein K|nr:type II secretion system protein GspK [Polyangiaceae bacterium]
MSAPALPERSALPRAWKRRKQERGVALIMVLGAIAVMVVMLAEFQDDAGAEFAAATAVRDGVQAEYFARSAVNLSRLLIAAEPTMRSAIAPLFMLMKQTPPQLPVWGYADRILGAFNDKEASQDFAGLGGFDLSLGKNLGLKGGSFEVVIVDEDSKINVNMGASNEIAHIRLAKQLMSEMFPIQYNPLFEQRDSTGNYNDRLSICSALIDWADPDEQLFSCDTTNAPSSNAVEDGWYQLLAKPYRRKNAPYDSLEELHMVRGVSDDFWSTFVDPEPTDPKKRQMTVWGQGAVNVNTANPLTLYALVCSGAPTAELCTDPTQMQMFIMGVTMAQGISMGAPVFGRPSDFIQMMKGQGQLGPIMTAMGMKPIKFQSESEFAKSIATESKVFSIYAVGVVKGYKRQTRVRIHTVVDFGSTPPLTSLTGAASAAPAPTAAPASGGGAAVAGQGPNAITTALQPSVGGQVLYFNIE